MSIETAITAAQGKVANAYTAISEKGGTLPQTQNLSNLPTAIDSIPSGSSSSSVKGHTKSVPAFVLNEKFKYITVQKKNGSNWENFPLSNGDMTTQYTTLSSGEYRFVPHCTIDGSEVTVDQTTTVYIEIT